MHYPHPISIAPMMEYTDRHFRYFARLITRRTLLYTEMITTQAILYGDRERLLAYHPAEHPLALQLGGSDPHALAQCAKIAEEFGYDEINLNVGCPSDRVQEGKFGACLMKEPALVADCVAAMKAVVNIPVTVKTRIGVDEFDSYEYLSNFIKCVAAADCEIFSIHARKAWLNGLSPKENRTIPPLKYAVAYQLKQDFPQLKIILNGGIDTIDAMQMHLEKVDGVMIGRQAYHHPYLLSVVDKLFYQDDAVPLSRLEVIEKFLPYMEKQLSQGMRLTSLTRHVLGLFYSSKGANAWRRYISENAHKKGANIDVLLKALEAVEISVVNVRF